MDSTEKLLKELTEARATVGHEDEVRRIMAARLGRLGEVRFDGLGSVLCELRGSADRPRVMLAAHMDEIGFLVKHVTKGGFLRLYPLGGWMPPVLSGQRMAVQTAGGDVPAVIGSRPPHGVPREERHIGPKLAELYADIGATSREEVAAAGVRVGDPVVPDAPFVPMRDPQTYLAKAFDDRAGCALLIELMEAFASRPHPNTLVAAATVQEEPLTERGAATSLEFAKPDVAIILEGALAEDTPDHGEDGPVRLGGGPGLSVGDDGVVLNPRLRDLVTGLAEKAGIPLQPHVLAGGHTDGMVIQQHRGGVPTVTFGVPMRYVHCHSGIMKRSDYDGTLRLIGLLIEELSAATVSRLGFAGG